MSSLKYWQFLRSNREHKFKIISNLPRSDCKMTFELIDGAKIGVISVVNVVYDAQPMLIAKNAVHPREVNTIMHTCTHDTGVAGLELGRRTNERSIDRSIDPWKREYAPVRFLLIERQLLAAAHVRSRIRVVFSKISSTEKCAKTTLNFVDKVS